MPDQRKPKIFICIPVHNRINYTVKCLDSVWGQTYSNWQVIICDDGSTDGTPAIVRNKFSSVIIESGNGNLFWAGGMNRCVEKALSIASDEDFIYTLNNDTELLPNTLAALLEKALAHPGSIIGTLNLFYQEPSRIENSAFIFNGLSGFRRLRQFGELRREEKGLFRVDGLAGKGALIPCKVFRSIGVYEDKLLPHYHADLEFTFRAKKAGFKIFIDFDSHLLSHQGESGIGSVMSAPNLKEFLKSFSSIRSTHHLPSLVAFSKLIYGRLYFLPLVRDLLFVNLGFLKRWVLHKLNKK